MKTKIVLIALFHWVFSPIGSSQATVTLTVKTGTADLVGGPLLWDQIAYYYNGALKHRWVCGGEGFVGGLTIAVFDTTCGSNWISKYSDVALDTLTYYYYNQVHGNIHCKSRDLEGFDFPTIGHDSVSTNALQLRIVDFINSIPDSDYVLVYSVNAARYDLWKQDLVTIFTSLGSSQVNALTSLSNAPWVFFVKKGSPSTVVEQAGNSINDIINFSATFECVNTNSSYFNSTSVWIYGGGEQVSFIEPIAVEYDRINYVDGDTLINNTLYYKIYSDHQDTFTNWQTNQITGIDSSGHLYYSALRDQAGIVYQILSNDTVERLVFDYNLHLGDTLPSCPYEIIADIDTVPFAGSYRNVFKLDSYGGVFVEGVGSRWGLSVDCPSSIAIEGALYLLCYSMNGDTISVNGDHSCSIFYTGISPHPTASWMISPNPFSDHTIINTNGLNKPYDFSLYDVSGKLKKKITSIKANQFELKRDGLPAGIYIYQIETMRKNVANGKLIIQ